MVIRIVYFLLIGWWLGALAAGFAFLCCATFIGLPIGTMIFNRLPSIMTLLAEGEDCPAGYAHRHYREDIPMILRIVYFFLIGWEIGLIMLGLGYFLILTVIGIPFGLIVLNYLPMGMTLSRRYQ